MEKELIDDGWEVVKFKCVKCGFESNLHLSDLVPEVICPRWKCNVRYIHKDGDLVPEDYWAEKAIERAKDFPTEGFYKEKA